MKYVKRGNNYVLVIDPIKTALRFDDTVGRFTFEDYEDIKNLLDEGLIEEKTEKEACARFNLSLNERVVYRMRAEDLARERHAGQTDKSGKPYFTAHIKPVTEMVVNLFGGGYLPTIALLHDLLEDTATTKEELETLFPQEVVEAVDALTRKKGETYKEYISRVKENPLAQKVKLCDLLQNMNPDRLLALEEGERSRLTKKYAEAIAQLTN